MQLQHPLKGIHQPIRQIQPLRQIQYRHRSVVPVAELDPRNFLPPPTPHAGRWSDAEDEFMDIPLRKSTRGRGRGSAARGSGFYSPVEQEVGLYGGRMAVAVGSSQDFAAFRRVQDLLDQPGGLQPQRRQHLISAAPSDNPPPSPYLRPPRPPSQPAARPSTLMDVNLDQSSPVRATPVSATPRPPAATYHHGAQTYYHHGAQTYSGAPDGRPNRVMDHGVHFGGDRSCGYGLPHQTDLLRDYGASSRIAPLPYLGEPDSRVTWTPPGTEHVLDKPRATALAGEYVNLSDFLVVTIDVNVDQIKTVIDENGCLSLKPTKPRKQILSSFKWLDAWAVYEILLAHALGVEVFNEMALYRIFITSLFATYKLPHVLSYDMRHRQVLGASRSLNFRTVNHQFYVVTFDVTAVKNSNRCGRCSSTDHLTSECPFRAPGQTAELPKNPKRQQSDRSGDKQKSDKADRAPSAEQFCFQFNFGVCRSGPKCPRRHVCYGCGGPNGIESCTKCKAKLATS